MAIFTTTAFRMLSFSILLLASLGLAKPAAATFTVNTSLGNFVVDTVGPPGKQSYDQAVVNNWMVPFNDTPWWGNPAAALDIAEQVRDAADLVGVSFRVVLGTFSNRVNFAWASNTSDGLQSGTQSRTTGTSLSTDGGFPSTQHAWVTQVPEIDGPVLAQAMFVLGSLYLLLRGKGFGSFRRRDAQHS